MKIPYQKLEPLQSPNFSLLEAKGLEGFTRTLKKLAKKQPTICDLEIAEHTGVSLRTTQRYIAALKQSGLIKVNRNRHLHAAYGWCNERTLVF